MISDILYRCPACGGFDGWVKGGCRACGAAMAVLPGSRVAVNGRIEALACWYDRVRAFDLPAAEDGSLLVSGPVRLAVESACGPYRGLGGLGGTLFARRPADCGRLTLYGDRLVFSGRQSVTLPFGSLTAVTIESDTLIVVARDHGALFFDFDSGSGKKWEDCLQQAVARHAAPRKIVEFCPQIRYATDLRHTGGGQTGRRRPRTARRRQGPAVAPQHLITVARSLTRGLITAGLRVRVEGLEHVPPKGAAIVMANHGSFLDAVLLAAFLPRHIWFMTKNSQYRHRLMHALLVRARSFPVRRYTTDLMAVRNALRVLDQGHVLGLFPEGERCWDGRLLPFKRGAARLVLAMGLPVLPVGLSGTYELMPRWRSALRRVPLTLRVGRPLRFDPVPIDCQCRQAVEGVVERLTQSIAALIVP